MPGIFRVRRSLIFLAVILLTASAAAVEETDFPTAGARSSISGLMLHATLPYDHYGPNDPVNIYLTFYNSSRKTLSITKDSPLLVEVMEKKELLRFTPEEAPLDEERDKTEGPVVLQPGETFVRKVILKWKKSAFLPGEHDMRVYCRLDGMVTKGRPQIKAVLKSNTVVLNIKYEVIMVY